MKEGEEGCEVRRHLQCFESERMPAPLNAEVAKKVEERKKQYIEELKAQANKELVDFEERPLEKWLKSCEMLRNQMDLAKQDGDSKRHYIFGMRLCNLGAHHPYPMPNVPHWRACVALRLSPYALLCDPPYPPIITIATIPPRSTILFFLFLFLLLHLVCDVTLRRCALKHDISVRSERSAAETSRVQAGSAQGDEEARSKDDGRHHRRGRRIQGNTSRQGGNAVPGPARGGLALP